MISTYQFRLEGEVRRRYSRERAERAYQLRALSKMPWKWIAKKLDFSDESSARRAAKRYQDREGLPDMPPYFLTLGEMAYTDRSEGTPWAEIASDLEISPSKGSPARRARLLARKYALRAGRPWPAMEQCPGQDRVNGSRRT